MTEAVWVLGISISLMDALGLSHSRARCAKNALSRSACVALVDANPVTKVCYGNERSPDFLRHIRVDEPKTLLALTGPKSRRTTQVMSICLESKRLAVIERERMMRSTFREPRTGTRVGVIASDFGSTTQYGELMKRKHVLEAFERRCLLSGYFEGQQFPNTNLAELATVLDYNGDAFADVLTKTNTILPGTAQGTLGAPVATLPFPQSFVGSYTAGDYNGDGLTDVAVSFSSSFPLAVTLQQADGTFAPYTTLATGLPGQSSPQGARLLSADLNDDSRDDLVALVFSGSQNRVTVHLSAPGGATVMQVVTSSLPPSDMDAADFDGDGDIDIAVTTGAFRTLQLLQNTAGILSAPTSLQMPTSVTGVASADIDGDGKVELLAMANSVYRVPVSADGLLGSPISLGFTATDVVAGNFNDDDIVDLLPQQETPQLRLGSGDGTFSAGQRLLGSSFQKADINGDGRDDLALIASPGGRTTLYLSQPNRRLAATRAIPSVQGGSGVADMNMDGNPDIVNSVNWVGGTIQVQIHFGDGDGTYGTPIYAPGASHHLSPLTVGNVNDHERPEILGITVPPAGLPVEVHVGITDQNGLPTHWVISSTFPLVDQIWVADLNGDQRPDLIGRGGTTIWDKGLFIQYNLGDSLFGPPVPIANTSSTTFLLADDLNQDGRTDLLTSGNGYQIISQTDNGFVAADPVSLNHDRAVMGVADVNNDGLLDLLALRGVFLGLSEQTFGPKIYYSHPNINSSTAIAARDVDRDGFQDLIVGYSDGFSVHKGNGTGAFTGPDPYVSSSGRLQLVDVNGDGLDDVIAGATLSLAIDRFAPQLVEVSFDPTQSLAVDWEFNERMDQASVAFDSMNWTNVNTGETGHANGVEWLDGRTARFALPPQATDGDYRFTLAAGSIRDRAGNQAPNNLAFQSKQSFILAGDINRDRAVNFDDLLILAQNYGQNGKTFSQGNIDYSADGLVGFDDLLLLAQRYGTTLLTAPMSKTVATKRLRHSDLIA